MLFNSSPEDYLEESTWACWQCHILLDTPDDLLIHLNSCKSDYAMKDTLRGCPYCSSDGDESSMEPYDVHEFNQHLNTAHHEVKTLKCQYCNGTTRTNNLLDLINHIFLYHKVYWKPSPSSLSHLRTDSPAHRVLTCLGCGFCSFVLRSGDVATPSSWWQAHMLRCLSRGGEVVADKLPTHISDLESNLSPNIIEELCAKAEEMSAKFAHKYYFSRGQLKTPQRSMKKIFITTDINFVDKSESEESKSSHTGTPIATEPQLPSKTNIVKKYDAALLEGPKAQPNYNENVFDVPLTLAPPKTCRPSGRIFSCPLCGEKDFPSLRFRDEHLLEVHNKELLFPCQLCGMAYPFYIALRRHAVFKHNSDFDRVLYGSQESLDASYGGALCPKCPYISFVEPKVLKMHVSIMHKDDSTSAPSTPSNTSKKVNPPSNSDDQPRKRGRPLGSKNVKKKHDNTGSLQPGEEITGTSQNGSDKSMNLQFGNYVNCQPPNTSPGNQGNTVQNFGLGELEQHITSMSHSTSSAICAECHLELHNDRELVIHNAIEHSTYNEHQQVGCSVCGRIFFGESGRIDLIGHFNMAHVTATDDPQALSLQKPIICGELLCQAMFSSPRLKQTHRCPLQNVESELTGSNHANLIELAKQLGLRCSLKIIATELICDRENCFVLAYGCPYCGYVFTGEKATERYVYHRENSVCNKSDAHE